MSNNKINLINLFEDKHQELNNLILDNLKKDCKICTIAQNIITDIIFAVTGLSPQDIRKLKSYQFKA